MCYTYKVRVFIPGRHMKNLFMVPVWHVFSIDKKGYACILHMWYHECLHAGSTHRKPIQTWHVISIDEKGIICFVDYANGWRSHQKMRNEKRRQNLNQQHNPISMTFSMLPCEQTDTGDVVMHSSTRPSQAKKKKKSEIDRERNSRSKCCCDQIQPPCPYRY